MFCGNLTIKRMIAFNLCPQSFGPLILRAAEFWTPQSVPRWVFVQCNVCPAFSWRHSYTGLNTYKNHLTIRFSLFFLCYFDKPLYFQRSLQPTWPSFMKTIFHWMDIYFSLHSRWHRLRMLSLKTTVWGFARKR